MSPTVQVKFFTSFEEYQIPDTILVLPTNLKRLGLSEVVHHFLNLEQRIPFQFLINKEILSTSIQEYVEENNLSTENVLLIEYMPADTPPEEKDCILHDDWISALKVTEKYYITGCYDGQIYVWDKNNSLVAKEIVHKKPIKCIDVFDDGGSILIVSGSLDRTISVNRFSHGKIERVFVGIGHKNSIYSVKFNASGDTIASGCFDSTIGIWSVYDDSYNKDVITVEKKKVQAKSCVTFMEGHKDAVTQVIFDVNDPDRLFSCGLDKSLMIWDLQNFVHTNVIACDVAFLNIVQSPFEPHWLASGHADGIIRIWNPLDKESVLYKKLPSNSPMNFALAWKPDNQFVLCAGSYDGSVRTFDLRHPKECLFIVKSAAEDDKVFVCEFDGNDLLFGGEAKKLNIFSN